MAKSARYLPWVPANLPKIVRQEMVATYARIDLNEAMAAKMDALAAKARLVGQIAGYSEQAARAQASYLRMAGYQMRTAMPDVKDLRLHWFTPAMASLTMALSQDYAHFWDPDPLLPSLDGLLIWEGGTGEWVMEDDLLWQSDTPVFVDGFRWHVCTEGVQITPLIHTSRLRARDKPSTIPSEIKQVMNRYFDEGKASGLMTTGPVFLYSQDQTTANRLDAYMRSHPWAYGFMAAVWASLIVLQQGPGLISEPVVVEGQVRTLKRTPKGLESGHGRTVGVRVVDVVNRTRYLKDETAEPHDKKWTLTHQHMVRAHIRNQPYGPGRSLRKPILIAPYVKGPEGAPFIEGDKVHLWRTPK